jgi:hypothetical protein
MLPLKSKGKVLPTHFKECRLSIAPPYRDCWITAYDWARIINHARDLLPDRLDSATVVRSLARDSRCRNTGDSFGVRNRLFRKHITVLSASQTARQTTVVAVSTATISRRRMGRSHTPWVHDTGTIVSSKFATYKALHGSLRKNRRVNSPPLWETSYQKLRQELLLQRTLNLQEPHQGQFLQ